MKIIDLKYFPPLRKGNYLFYPISISWGAHHFSDGEWKRMKGSTGAHAFICCHGWQVGWKNGQRVYGWTLHIGMLKIMFGRRKRGE